MESPVAVCIICLLLAICLTSEGVITVPSGNKTLQYYLCNASGQEELIPGTVLSLTPVHHKFSPGLVCVLSNRSRITINSTGKYSFINCTTGSGLGFHNVSDLTIKSIVFDNCGGLIPPEVAPMINSSRFYFLPNQQAAVFFSYCSNLSAYLMLEYPRGFGIIAFNNYGTAVELYGVIRGNGTPSATGAGALVYYTLEEETEPLFEPSKVHLDLHVYNVVTHIPPVDLIGCFADKPKRLRVVAAGGVTVIISENPGDNRNSSVHITTSLTLKYNQGFQAAGALFLFVNVLRSRVDVHYLHGGENLLLQTNSLGKARGTLAGVYLLFDDAFFDTNPDSKPVVVKPMTFRNVQMRFCQHCGGIFVEQMKQMYANYVVSFTSVTATNISNTAANSGILLYAVTQYGGLASRELSLNLTDLTVTGCCCMSDSEQIGQTCSGVGMLNFVRLLNVMFDGSSTFSTNLRASVIRAEQSSVYFTGEVLFDRNLLDYAGTVQIVKGSQLHFVEPFYGNFTSNKALFGGGIYAIDDSPTVNDCIIQFHTPSGDLNITIVYQENSAQLTGDFIYASPFYNCSLLDVNLQNTSDLTKLYNRVFQMTSSSSNSSWQIASTAVRIGLSNDRNKHSCDNSSRSKRVFPGQPFEVNVCACDVLGTPVFSIITTQFQPKLKDNSTLPVAIPPQQALRRVEHGECTPLTYDVLMPESSIATDNQLKLELAVYTLSPTAYINLTILPCPFGFSYAGDHCICGSDLCAIEKGVCNDTTGTFVVPEGYWMGNSSWNNVTFFNLSYAVNCPPAYCHNATIDLTNFQTNPEVMCKNNRSGVLCGQCKDGYSLMLGSNQCKKCSSLSLLFLFLFALAGILMIVGMLLFKVSVSTGTINGLVCYANAIWFSRSYFFPGTQVGVLEFFISIVSLDTGYPVCLYYGMNEFFKVCIHLLFPLYLWILIIVLVICSRKSSLVANVTGTSTISVLVTIMNASYYKLLSIVVTIVSGAWIRNIGSDKTQAYVWLYDGHLMFGEGLHAILLVTAVGALLVVIIPYTVFSIFSQCFIRNRLFNKWFMPMVDAIYAPYKDKWRFWFGLRLTIFVVTFILLATLRGINLELILLIQIFFFTAFSFLQIKISPFKSLAINILDLFFMINYCVLATFALFFDDDSNAMSVVTDVLVGTAFIVTIGILLFHIHLVLKANQVYMVLKKTTFCQKFAKIVSQLKELDGLDTVERAATSSGQASNARYRGYGSTESLSTGRDYSKYREPLLSGSYVEQ